ncbi:MAG: hypothetical protein LBV47_05405 [Bacteroidales bacterium]|nr:hypothetical protein [Bacteroidales bacterium]
MQYYKQHKKGIIGTFIFHVIVFMILIFLGFFTPLPLPGEEGILVNFGTSNIGFGEVESGPAQNNNLESIQRDEIETSSSQPQPISNSSSTLGQETSGETVVTQNIEQTAVINNAAEEARREEVDRRQKQFEEERQRQVELESQRVAETERIRREEQQRISEINTRTQNAFNNNGIGSDQQSNGTRTGEGVTFPEGNHGLITGNSNTNNYGQSNSGSGISFSLAGRSALSLPKPNYPGYDEGIVVVSVTVDKNGNVTAADPGVRGTTIMNRQFWIEAQQAALKAEFDIKENSPIQQGTITYRFTLQAPL